MAANASCVDAEIWPEGGLAVLSQYEVDLLKIGGAGGLYPLLRRCMLAVLNSGSNSDDTRALLETYSDFESELRATRQRTQNHPQRMRQPTHLSMER